MNNKTTFYTAFIFGVFVASCVEAQYTWQANRSSSDYTILKDGTEQIKDVQHFFGMSMKSGDGGTDFKVTRDYSLQEQEEQAIRKKERCDDPKITAQLRDLASHSLTAEMSSYIWSRPEGDKALKAPYYFIKKRSGLGLLLLQNNFTLEAIYDKVQVLPSEEGIIAVAQKGDSTSIIDISKGIVKWKTKGSVKAYFTTNEKMMYYVSSNEENKLLNHKFKTVFESSSRVKPLIIRLGVDVIIGFQTDGSGFSELHKLNGKSYKTEENINQPVYDCSKNEYVLSYKEGDKYGLTTFDGKRITEPISEERVQPTISQRYLIVKEGKMVYLK